MPSAIWSGTISFGLVSVPVRLYSAVKPKTVRFHQLDRSDHARIQQKRVSSTTGEEVAYSEIVKGYEIAPDRYVVVDPDELASLGASATNTIEIEDFVDLTEIDPIFYDHAYYLVPSSGAEKPYELLLDAMAASEKVAVARVVLRSKEHLVAIRPMGKVLGMATMNFADEIVSVQELPGVPDHPPKLADRERDIARQLVDSLASEFDPSKYHDTYREAVLDLIERKAEGEEITVQRPATPTTAAPDLMGALQASLDEIRKRDGKRTAKKPRKPATGPASPDRDAPTPKRTRGRAGGAAKGGSHRRVRDGPEVDP